MKKITLRKLGGSIGASLPKEMIDRLHLDAGDEMYAIEKDGGVFLVPHDPAFEEAVGAYAAGARKYRNALRELAKARDE